MHSKLALAALFAIGIAVNSQTPPATEWDRFVDQFLAGRDARHLPELTVTAFATELASTQAQLAALRAIDPGTLSPDDALDRRFVESVLVGQELTERRMRVWRMDPRVYMRSFETIQAILASGGDVTARADVALESLNAIPSELRAGQRNLSLYVARFQDRSLTMAEAGAVTMRAVSVAADQVPARKEALIAASAAASQAIVEWLDFLKVALPKRPVGYPAIGVETYAALLEGQFLLSYDPESLAAYAQREFDRTIEELEAVAQEIDPEKEWLEIVESVKHQAPDPAKEIETHQEWVDKARDHVLRQGLIPIPWKERVDVVPRIQRSFEVGSYGRLVSAAPHPSADGSLVAQWQIDVLDQSADDAVKKAYLADHDLAQIMMLAPHETYAGRHVQTLYQMHNARRLRRELTSPVFSDGWALYNEELMGETGFYPDERAHLRQLHRRLSHIACVLEDVGLHTGTMTYAQAATLLTEQVGLTKPAAEAAIDAAIDRPGACTGSFIGMSEIVTLRGEVKDALGSEFTLGGFHERLLKIGAMPPALMRDALMSNLSSGRVHRH